MEKSEKPVDQGYTLSFETKGAHTEESAAESLFDALSSDPDFGHEEKPKRKSEPKPRRSVEEDEDDAEELEDIDDAEERDERDEDDHDDDDSEDREDSDEDDEEDRDDQDDDEHEELESIDLDGEEVTLEQIRDWKKRGLRLADYTRKTQKAAEERKQVAAERNAVLETRKQYDELLGALETALTPQEPDWDALREKSVDEFNAAWAAFQIQKTKLEKVKAERTRVQQEAFADFQKQYREKMQAEHELLIKAVPEWKDKKTRLKELQQMHRFATSHYGFSDQDMQSALDHRVYLLLRDAMLFNQRKAKKEDLRKHIKRARVLKPGSGRPERRGPKAEARAARQRLARTGSIRDAAAAIASILD